jgi:hypothetical protein
MPVARHFRHGARHTASNLLTNRSFLAQDPPESLREVAHRQPFLRTTQLDSPSIKARSVKTPMAHRLLTSLLCWIFPSPPDLPWFSVNSHRLPLGQ